MFEFYPPCWNSKQNFCANLANRGVHNTRILRGHTGLGGGVNSNIVYYATVHCFSLLYNSTPWEVAAPCKLFGLFVEAPMTTFKRRVHFDPYRWLFYVFVHIGAV